jgi:hypothetical protein
MQLVALPVFEETAGGVHEPVTKFYMPTDVIGIEPTEYDEKTFVTFRSLDPDNPLETLTVIADLDHVVDAVNMALATEADALIRGARALEEISKKLDSLRAPGLMDFLDRIVVGRPPVDLREAPDDAGTSENNSELDTEKK